MDAELVALMALTEQLKEYVAWHLLERIADDWEKEKGQRINHIWFVYIPYEPVKAISDDDPRFDWFFMSMRSAVVTYSSGGTWRRDKKPDKPVVEMAIYTLDNSYVEAMEKIVGIAKTALAGRATQGVDS